jgi:dihydrofolate reductase
VQEVESYGSVDEALLALRNEDRVFVIGGGEVYTQLLPRADELYLTVIDRNVEADTFFPPYEHLLGTTFILVRSDVREGFRFEDYARRD